MEFEERKYQTITIEKIIESLNLGKNTLLQAPTAFGKSVCLAKICEHFIKVVPNFRILFALDREILITQLKQTIQEVNKNTEIGIACKSVQHDVELDKQITLCSRQTVTRHLDSMEYINLLIIDECHLFPLKNKSDYEPKSQFSKIYATLKAKNPKIRMLGVTATAYSLQAGYIYGKCHKPGLIPYFDEICHKVTYKELTSQGYLSPLIGKIAENSVDLSNIDKIAGEFNLGQLSDEMILHVDTIKEAIDKYCDGRKSILIFCVSIEHVEAVNAIFNNSVMIHSKMSKEDRKQSMYEFKSGQARIAVSVNVLSIGFDHPATDCIILARPTQATSLALQQLGRGLRTFKGKENCLLIDVTDNIAIHFPTFDLDRPNVKIPKASSSGDDEEEKTCQFKMCPECGVEVHNATKICPDCHYEWPDELMEAKYLPKMQDVTFDAAKPTVWKVNSVRVDGHISKKNQKELMKIIIEISNDNFETKTVYQWICFEDYYEGYAVKKGAETWKQFCSVDFPLDLTSGLWIAQESFKSPTTVTCEQGDNNFLNIISMDFTPLPEIEYDSFQYEDPAKAYDINDYSDEIPF